MIRRAALASLLTLSAFHAGCSSDPVPTDAATDTQTPTDNPVGTDVAVDRPSTDAQADVAVDRPSTDAQTDVPAADTAADVPAADASDASALDAAVDAAADVTPATDVAADTTPAVDATPADAATDAAPSDVAPTDAGPETMYVATLTSAQEVPTNTSAATGTAQLFLNGARNSVRFVIHHTVSGANAAHIHIGMAGQNGGIAIPFASAGADITGTADVTADQVAALDEDRWYVNVHSTANPGGEIRGQVLRPGETLYVAQLTGAQEVPAVTTTQTGVGSLIVNADRSVLRYRVASMLMPTAAHVHTAPGGVAGGVTFAISPLGSLIAGVQPVSPSISLTDLEAGRWYFNLHTTANPGGEIRGQILRPGEVLFTTQLAGANEVPPVTTTATGSAAVILSADRGRLAVEGTFTGLTAVTASHLHSAPAGMNGGVSFPLTVTGMNLTGALTVSASATTGFLDALLGGGVYVNVHTTANAGGEIRGQLARRTP